MADRHKADDKPKAVRMPTGLPARVKAAAADDGVSVNGFIVAAIEEKLDRRGGGSTTPTDTRRPEPAPAARAHALNCKCGVCKTRKNGGQQ